MSKVEFIYGKGGKKVLMARRYAETLRKLGHGIYADTSVEAGYRTRMLTAGSPVQTRGEEPKASATVVPSLADEEPKVSAAILEFAKENGVDIETVVGTGKDGRIKKSDIEAVIAAQDLA